MSELMRLYNPYLCPASDTLLDLGSGSLRWKNFYLSGSIAGCQVMSVSNLTASSASIAVFVGTTLIATSISATSIMSSPLISSSSVNAVIALATILRLSPS